MNWWCTNPTTAVSVDTSHTPFYAKNFLTGMIISLNTISLNWKRKKFQYVKNNPYFFRSLDGVIKLWKQRQLLLYLDNLHDW